MLFECHAVERRINVPECCARSEASSITCLGISTYVSRPGVDGKLFGMNIKGNSMPSISMFCGLIIYILLG